MLQTNPNRGTNSKNKGVLNKNVESIEKASKKRKDFIYKSVRK